MKPKHADCLKTEEQLATLTAAVCLAIRTVRGELEPNLGYHPNTAREQVLKAIGELERTLLEDVS